MFWVSMSSISPTTAMRRPDDISITPISSLRAVSSSIPKGRSSNAAPFAAAGSTPEITSIFMSTVKKITNPQIFRVEAKELFTPPVNAVAKPGRVLLT